MAEADPEARAEAWLTLQGVCALIPPVDLAFAPLFPLLPDVPPDPLWSRVAISVVALATWALAAALPAVRARSDVLLLGVLVALHAVTAYQVVSSGNHPLYVAAALLAVFGSQLALTRVRDLAVVLGGGFGAYLALAVASGRMSAITDVSAAAVLGCGVAIAAVMGLLRIRNRDRERAARRDLARRTEELARAEVVAREARVYAEAANHAKSAFLANMSHEIRTPLNAILGYAELLRELAAEDGLDHLTSDLDRIHGAGSHLLTLINDVLDLAKVEAGRMEVRAETFVAGTFLGELADLARPVAAQRGNRLEVRGDADFHVTLDRVRLRQVLLNLISNAAKFTENGTIAVIVRREGARLRIDVQDTGVGMAPEQLGRLFEAFVQVHEDRERYGGTGLGLVLCKRFTELMRGTLSVTSAVGQGTTFTVDLPIGAPIPD